MTDTKESVRERVEKVKEAAEEMRSELRGFEEFGPQAPDVSWELDQSYFALGDLKNACERYLDTVSERDGGPDE